MGLEARAKDVMDVVTTADPDQSHARLDVEIPPCAAYQAMSAAPTLNSEARLGNAIGSWNPTARIAGIHEVRALADKPKWGTLELLFFVFQRQSGRGN